MEQILTDQKAETVDEKLALFHGLEQQRRALESRLAATEKERDSVDARIYKKVRSGYEIELEAVESRVAPLKADFERVCEEWRGECHQLKAELAELDDEVAEAEFRARVGEYEDEKVREIGDRVAPRLREIKDEIERIEARINSIEGPGTGKSADQAGDVENGVVPHGATKRHRGPRDAADATPETDPTDWSALADAPAATRLDFADDDTDTKLRPPRDDKRADHDSDSSDALDIGDSLVDPQTWAKELTSEPDARRPRAAGTRGGQSKKAAGAADTPASIATPFLVIVESGKRIPLLPMTTSLGREHDNNIELKDPEVARYHARILHRRGEYVLEDLESSSGTLVNGDTVRRISLEPGDLIRMGSTELKFEAS